MSSSFVSSRRDCLRFAMSAAVVGVSGGVRAQSYPDRTVRIVVPFAPGAGTDAMGRLMANKLSELMQTPVVVENKTGASGAIGAQAVAQSPADGHTLLLAAAPFTTVPAALSTAGYDPLKDFAPVGMFATGPLVWVVGSQVPVNSMQELLAMARRRPGALNYGSAGVGGVNHLLLEMFKARTGTFITHIPYRGISPAVADTLGGQIQLLTGTIPALLPMIREGRLKALAVTSARRSAVLPQVPSMAEVGLHDFDVLNYFALVAPRGTPAPTVQTLNAALSRAAKLQDVQVRLSNDALEAATDSPDQLARFLSRDFAAWKDVVQRQNLRIDSV